MKTLATAMAATALLAAPATAQETTDGEAPDVVVSTGVSVGSPLERQVATFFGEVAAPAIGGDSGVARWNTPICVGAENLDVEAAQYIVDRISLIALELGVDIGEPGCAPDISVIFTMDGKATATSMVEMNGRSMHSGVGGIDRGGEALETFASSEEPVRWWQISIPTDARSGKRMVQLPGDPRYGDPDFGGVHRDIGGGSRLYTQTREDLTRVVVIVDVSKVEGLNWTQVADYLAMVTLAQIDPDADTSGFDTILNLFDGDAPASITAWDMAYLQALYSTDALRQPVARAADLTGAMARIHREQPEIATE